MGDAQGLAFFNQAMRSWPRATPRTRLNRAELDSPVDRWLFDTLKTAFFLHENEYPTWAKVVGDSDPRLQLGSARKLGNLTSGFLLDYMPETPTPVESLIAADKKRLIGLVKQSTGNPERLSTQLREFVAGRPDVTRWTFEKLFGAKDNGLVPKLTIEQPWLQALEDAAEMCEDPWRSRYQNLIAFSTSVLPILAVASNAREDNYGPAAEEMSSFFSRFGFPMTAGAFSKQFKILAGGVPPDKTPNSAVPNLPWWNRNFLDFFGSVVVDFEAQGKKCDDPGPQCAEIT